MDAVYPPSPSMFGSVPGYEGTVAGGGGFVPPPMPLEPVAPPMPNPGQADWSIPCISEEVAQEAFKRFVSSQCCYSKSPAADGVIRSLEPLNTYRYRLETFTESRSTEWAHKPHQGEPADFYTQTAPRPWEIQATPPKLFTNHTQEIRVPFTASIKECHGCHASGQMPCKECNGAGSKECWVCHGSGNNGGSDCSHCHSTGRESCEPCVGQGTRDCETCEGKRQLLTFIQLKVEWNNWVEDHVVVQSGGLKAEDLSSITGKELFKTTQNLVYPLLGFPDSSVSEASERLVTEHQAKFTQSSSILQQRQTVELIPVTKVNYTWKEGSYCYYVYGNEHQVTASDYPATCCCVLL